MLVPLLQLLIAALSSVIIAFVWFRPQVFGAAFMRDLNLSPEQVEKGKRQMLPRILAAFLASVVAAYVMSYFARAWGVYDWVGAIELGFWCWLGFAAPPMLGMVLWEMRSVRSYLSVALFWLLAFIVMALILVY